MQWYFLFECAKKYFQKQILPPSETDIVVCILWSRLGTRLPEQFCRDDGSRYASGTEWEFEDALKTISEATDPKVISAAYRKAHERLVDNPPWLYIVHDLNPRAMSPKVKGFVSPQSWFVDLTLVSVQ